ncbi:hypothetical protein PI95_004235 [Hassallia byssoidea VB512170]|uniref:Uncharacterized protein n=1 Tax=Hassallia byssoidea VB512170 TaxID=1304833 RepID=A0A846H596_9CYAN|nr:hypothetical protein [Hassalia byssoidea]NEU71804.1 hypothetical protein [Hassalia byssoidea VB512170]
MSSGIELVSTVINFLFPIYLFSVIFSFICWLFYIPAEKSLPDDTVLEEPPITVSESLSTSKLEIDSTQQLEETLLPESWADVILSSAVEEVQKAQLVLVGVTETEKMMGIGAAKLRKYCKKNHIKRYSAIYNKDGKAGLVQYLIGMGITSSKIVDLTA